MNKNTIANLITIFTVGAMFFGAATAADLPKVYTGNFPHGLVVKENNAIVENASISNDGSGIGLQITGDNVTVRNSFIHDTQDHGVQFYGTNGGTFINNEIYHAAMRNKPNSISGGWPSSLKVRSVNETPDGLAQDILIENNYIHDSYGECMGLRGSRITVRGNVVQDCFSVGIYSNSDHTLIERNFVLCTGNPIYKRGGYDMSGIGTAEETFSGWGAHGHDSQTIVNNIVEGCKFGFRYGTSSKNMGLANTVIAFNTFNNIESNPVSITYYSNMTQVIVHNNISSKPISVRGANVAGNVIKAFPASISPNGYRLTQPVPILGSFTIATDFDDLRIPPLDAGAFDFDGGIFITETPPPTFTFTPPPSPTLTRTPTPVFPPTNTPIPSVTPTRTLICY